MPENRVLAFSNRVLAFSNRVLPFSKPVLAIFKLILTVFKLILTVNAFINHLMGLLLLFLGFHFRKKSGKTSFWTFEIEFRANLKRVSVKNRVSAFSGKSSFGQNVQKKNPE